MLAHMQFFVSGGFALLLLTRDIRDFNPRGFVQGGADFEAVRTNFNATALCDTSFVTLAK